MSPSMVLHCCLFHAMFLISSPMYHACLRLISNTFNVFLPSSSTIPWWIPYDGLFGDVCCSLALCMLNPPPFSFHFVVYNCLVHSQCWCIDIIMYKSLCMLVIFTLSCVSLCMLLMKINVCISSSVFCITHYVSEPT